MFEKGGGLLGGYVLYESPLNYIGSKSKIVSDIRSHAPAHYNRFIDAFGGGFNVGINISADSIMIFLILLSRITFKNLSKLMSTLVM